MTEIFVSKVAEFAEGDRRIVFHDGLEIGVFHWQGNFYAYQNLCLHQGGPCCEGIIMHKVEDVLGPDKTWLGQKFSTDEAHFVCPWHGYEYDIKTGECAGNRKLRLKSYRVVRRDQDVYDRGREGCSPSPPSEPYGRFSRIRLSSRQFPHRECLAVSQAVWSASSPAWAKNALGQR